MVEHENLRDVEMNDNERESVKELLKISKLAIIAMLIIGGYAGQDLLLGVF